MHSRTSFILPKKLLVVYTGGTIGMIQIAKHPYLKPVDFANIRHLIPEVERLPCELEFYSIEPPIDSSNILPEVWTRLAQLIRDRYDEFNGFVVLHGTDTMCYTASALSFMLQGLQKPVILTGSQLPVDIIRTDARENLITSLEIASHRQYNLPEVAIYFDSKLLRGNRSIKYSSEKFQAFISPNFPPLAEAGIDLDFFTERWLSPAPESPLQVFDQLTPRVALLKFFPGAPQEMVEYLINSPTIDSLVIETYGTGNLPNFPWLIGALEKRIQEGLTVVNITQCTAGRVMQGRYENGNDLQEIGVVSGLDMTTAAALTKLMYLNARFPNQPDAVRKAVGQNLCGELTEDKTKE